MMSTKKNTPPQQPQQQRSAGKNRGFPWTLFFTAIVALLCIGLLVTFPDSLYDPESIDNGLERHRMKPFKTWAEFYPYYLREHSDEFNRTLHFIGTTISLLVVLTNPVLINCLIIAYSWGYMACPLLSFLPHGFFELAILFGTFLIFALINKHFTAAFCVLLLGYAFAWVGHFKVEGNVPATFTYPTYSLLSDLRMWYEMLSGTVPGLREVVQHVRSGGVEYVLNQLKH